MAEEWRDSILKQIHILSSQVDSPIYGEDHALKVEKGVTDIIFSTKEFSNNTQLVIVTRAAALLHDLGFFFRSLRWSLDAVEHIQISKEIASKTLSMVPLFRDNPALIDKVLFLIEHHDDTAYSFPSATNLGRPFWGKKRTSLTPALRILQEADSFTHTVSNCLTRTIQFWKNSGLPDCVIQNNNVIPSWRWHDSIFSNLRLLGKRAVLDAFTLVGKHQALEAYDNLEEELKKICASVDVGYVSEACSPEFREESFARIKSKQYDLEVISFHGWNEMLDLLRGISLQYDDSLRPYENAQIDTYLVPLDIITPMSLYVMKTRLNEILEFHDALMVNLCCGLGDLPGILEFRYNSDEDQKIAPPIIERYIERASIESEELLGLLDGLHRCTVARDIGQKNIRVVVASSVPYPTEPLPVKWEQVKERRRKPKIKKFYRFENWQNVPNSLKEQFYTLTDQNFRNFFYRNLSPIGSTGMRGFDEFKKKHL